MNWDLEKFNEKSVVGIIENKGEEKKVYRDQYYKKELEIQKVRAKLRFSYKKKTIHEINEEKLQTKREAGINEAIDVRLGKRANELDEAWQKALKNSEKSNDPMDEIAVKLREVSSLYRDLIEAANNQKYASEDTVEDQRSASKGETSTLESSFKTLIFTHGKEKAQQRKKEVENKKSEELESFFTEFFESAASAFALMV